MNGVRNDNVVRLRPHRIHVAHVISRKQKHQIFAHEREGTITAYKEGEKTHQPVRGQEASTSTEKPSGHAEGLAQRRDVVNGAAHML